MSRAISRPQPEARRFPIHYSQKAPMYHVCEAFDTACGVSSLMLDRHVTGDPALVTCRRCRTEHGLCGQFWTWLYQERRDRGCEPSDAEKNAHPALVALRKLRAGK